MTSSPSRSSSEPIFHKLKILKVSQIYTYHIALFMFKYTKGMLPSMFNDMFLRCADVVSRTTRNIHKFRVPQFRTNLFKNSLKGQGSLIWNKIEEHVDYKCSFHTFKKRCKAYCANQ
jgi:hypothetical protein